MIDHSVRVHRSDELLAREEQLAWKIAEVAIDDVVVSDEVAEMVVNRIIDDAAVAAASIGRAPVSAARDQARCHTASPGATVMGEPHTVRVSPEWAAWANGVAVRELDFHDTFLAAEYAHPGDGIPPILAVAQHLASRYHVAGHDVVRGIATSYEVQIELARAIDLHSHRIDHVAHLGPSVVAGIGSLLALDVGVVYQALGQSLHTSTATRQSRKGEISSWKAYAPAFAGKGAIEAVDRAMRGQTSPSPIYEGDDGVIAWLLDGPDATYSVSLPGPGEDRRAILESFTKEYSAEYQAQAWIDLARRLGRRYPELKDATLVDEIVLHTSNHTHDVIGSGAKDPQKYSPDASRETLDHSLSYILAVALQDGTWHHEHSYTTERAHDPATIALWRKIRTVEDPVWTRRYHAADPNDRAYGGRIEVRMTNGEVVIDEIIVPDAHPLGARPFAREQYVEKFRQLSEGVVHPKEAKRFLDVAQRLNELTAVELSQLTFESLEVRGSVSTVTEGIF